MTFKDFMSGKRENPEILHFGCWWSLTEQFPKYIVHWIKGTGELYAVSCSGRHPDEEDVVQIGTFPAQKEVEEFMRGWRDVMSKPNSLSSLLARNKR